MVVYIIFIIFNSFILVLQNNSTLFTLNRVKCQKQILPPVGFKLKFTADFNLFLL